MTITFIELTQFAELREAYLSDDEGFRELQNHLLNHPTDGNIIPGGGGVRKLRWKDVRRDKGKRGGLRVIYLYVVEASAIALFTMYDKDKATDLTSEQKRFVAELAESVKREIIETLGKTKV